MYLCFIIKRFKQIIFTNNIIICIKPKFKTVTKKKKEINTLRLTDIKYKKQGNKYQQLCNCHWNEKITRKHLGWFYNINKKFKIT